MKDILKNIFIGIILLGLFWVSLAIIVLTLFSCIIGNITGAFISIILIFGIWTIAFLLSDKNEKE